MSGGMYFEFSQVQGHLQYPARNVRLAAEKRVESLERSVEKATARLAQLKAELSAARKAVAKLDDMTPEEIDEAVPSWADVTARMALLERRKDVAEFMQHVEIEPINDALRAAGINFGWKGDGWMISHYGAKSDRYFIVLEKEFPKGKRLQRMNLVEVRGQLLKAQQAYHAARAAGQGKEAAQVAGLREYFGDRFPDNQVAPAHKELLNKHGVPEHVFKPTPSVKRNPSLLDRLVAEQSRKAAKQQSPPSTKH